MLSLLNTICDSQGFVLSATHGKWKGPKTLAYQRWLNNNSLPSPSSRTNRLRCSSVIEYHIIYLYTCTCTLYVYLTSPVFYYNFFSCAAIVIKINKRPMDHIAHLSNLGPYRSITCISFPFAPFDPRGPMILINLPLFYVRKLSCKTGLRIRFLNDPTPLLSPLWRGPGPLIEGTWIPFTKG
jgi:hypothetical protein